MEKQSIERILYSETEKRLNLMEQADYEFPERIAKSDAAMIIGSVALCVILIALCMTGVIR
ncbi:MAG: hypothetical protein HFI93_06255 [Lachnospiraceae bacterium]|nr:hypothetical protein [Lachnospiraceae bacterium]